MKLFEIIFITFINFCRLSLSFDQYMTFANNMQIPSTMNEDITTIFVVGFPEDMQEREFQNLFTFSYGFEAATLKTPQPEEESSRKQIIGFAKFRTKTNALEAIEILNGRKIDIEKGCVLKAEMAKKNLHTKRSIAQDFYRLSSSRQYINQAFNGISIDGNHNNEFSLLPSDLGLDLGTGLTNVNPEKSLANYMTERDKSVGLSNSLTDLRLDIGASNARKFNCYNGVDILSRSCISDVINDDYSPASGVSYSIFSASVPGYSAPGSEEPTPLTATDKSTINTPLDGNNYSSQMNQYFQNIPVFSPSITSPFSPVYPGVQSNRDTEASPQQQSQPVAQSPGIYSVSANTQAFKSVKPVPSDQENPPCNTLYVGNLPMDASESELRALFGLCNGYRRLLFRVKSNGPMCFVEFESIGHATQAMNDLYGYALTNSTKGKLLSIF